jgi:hypothetical protein
MWAVSKRTLRLNFLVIFVILTQRIVHFWVLLADLAQVLN